MDAEVARVAERVHRGVMRLMEQRGLGPRADPKEADALRRDEPLLAALCGASISGRVATGPRAGKRIVRVGDRPDSENAAMKPRHCCALVEGFSVHAGVCVPARDRVRLERPLRYASRPPLSNERLSLLPPFLTDPGRIGDAGPVIFGWNKHIGNPPLITLTTFGTLI